VKGKPWTAEEEKQLQMMLQQNKSVRVIAKALGKTRDCIRMKIARLEVVVQGEKNTRTTTTCPSLILPTELSSIEVMLKTLAAALKTLETPGLERNDVLRLRGIIAGAKVYNDLLAEYADYRGLETELVELREKYAEFSKKSPSLQPK
jgi:hypothetical protein